MKKRNTILRVVSMTILLSLVVGLFSGCGKPTDKDENGRTVISVGSWPSTEGKELDDRNAQKDRFEEANPDIAIKPDKWTFDRKTFYAKAAGNELPTVYQAGFTEMPEIISSGYSADLTDALKKYGYIERFNPDVLEVVTNDEGRIVALPKNAYILGLAYNTKLFEEAGLMETDGTPKQPKDWYELAEYAAKIKETTGTAGIVLHTANNAGGWTFTPIAWSFGADFMEKDSNGKWKATFASPECAAALQWVKDLKWKYDVLPSNSIVDINEAYKLYGTGKAAMYITAGDIPPRVVKYGMLPEELGMMALPAGPEKHVTLLGGMVTCVNAGATKDQIDAAIRWYNVESSYDLTEEFKTINRGWKENARDAGEHIGIKSMSIWTDVSEKYKFGMELIDEFANANPNHVKLYNEFCANCPAEIQPEEPVCCQELYAILDGCIQEVLTNKDADPMELLTKAANDFQVNYLDNLLY